MTDEGTYTYRFEPVSACVMCGSSKAKTLGRRLNGHQGLRPRHNVGVAATVVRCEQCGLIYSNPRPVPESLEQHYDRPPEDYWRETQLQENDEHPGIPIARFRQLWSGSEPPRALDVGAGLGQTMVELSREGCDTWGCEPSAAFRDRAIERGVSGDRLQLAAVEDADYEPAAFDLISFGAVLEHVRDPASSLERALGWLAPGGLMFVEVPSARWLMARLLNIAYRAQGLDYLTNLSPMHPPYHLYEFTLDAFVLHGRSAGYKVSGYEFVPCETFLPGVLTPITQRIMAATDTGMQLQLWLAPSATA
jgi:SAM-dependent methyltransferase